MCKSDGVTRSLVDKGKYESRKGTARQKKKKNGLARLMFCVFACDFLCFGIVCVASACVFVCMYVSVRVLIVFSVAQLFSDSKIYLTS